jgi:hypothetical protein
VEDLELMRLDEKTEVCDRCSMLLHASLVQFHKCNGTNMSARPANVPEGVWNEALMKALGAKQVEKRPANQEAVTPDIASVEEPKNGFEGALLVVFSTVAVLSFFALLGWLAYLGGK